MPIARALRDAGVEVVLVAPPGDYVERLEAEGFDFEPWRVSRRGTNPASGLAAITRLAAIYGRRDVGTALHFTMKPVFLGTAAARVARVPLVVNTFTGLGYLFGQSVRARLLRRALAPYSRLAFRGAATRVVVQNASDGVALREAGWIHREADMVVVPGSGVDISSFVRERHDREGVTVIFAGRLLRSKGVPDLVEAARILRQDTPAVRVRVLGAPDPGNPDTLQPEEIEAWRAEGIVELPGHVADIAGALAEADIAVLPSDREGLPRFLLEAGAAGLPSVATAVPGNRDVVDDGVTGLLVPFGSPSDLARAIAHLAADKRLRGEMGQAARRKVVESYSDATIAATYLRIVLGRDRDGRRT
jgi:glycosyltransferase involved in cell wall biosynthesis